MQNNLTGALLEGIFLFRPFWKLHVHFLILSVGSTYNRHYLFIFRGENKLIFVPTKLEPPSHYIAIYDFLLMHFVLLDWHAFSSLKPPPEFCAHHAKELLYLKNLMLTSLSAVRHLQSLPSNQCKSA